MGYVYDARAFVPQHGVWYNMSVGVAQLTQLSQVAWNEGRRDVRNAATCSYSCSEFDGCCETITKLPENKDHMLVRCMLNYTPVNFYWHSVAVLFVSNIPCCFISHVVIAPYCDRLCKVLLIIMEKLLNLTIYYHRNSRAKYRTEYPIITHKNNRFFC